jgi:type IV pilus assembly protein PilA
MKRSKREAGFTLVELMIVVAIIGVLAAIAIPAFSRYVKKARTTEAPGHLQRMWAGSVAYYETDHVLLGSSTPAARQFPDSDVVGEPGAACGCMPSGRCPGNWAGWNAGTWAALDFSLPDPHHYRPLYASAGTGTRAVFTASAVGDLDCDSTLAIFRRTGGVSTETGDVVGNSAPEITNELE